METITKEQAVDMVIGKDDGKIFTVVFIKRTTGEKRVMNCRKGVKKGTTGEGLKFDPARKGLLPVFDMQKNKFRMISLESIKQINVDKKKFVVK